MNDNNGFCSGESELFQLIGKYNDGLLSDSEAERLLSLVQNNEYSAESLVQNVLIDILLHEKANTMQNIKSEYGTIPTKSDVSIHFSAQENQTEDTQNSLPAATSGYDWSDLISDDNPEQTIYIEHETEPSRIARWRCRFVSVWNRWTFNRPKKEPSPEILAVRKRRSNIFFIIRIVLFVAFMTWLSIEPSISVRDTIEQEGSVGHVLDTINAQWEENSVLFKPGQSIDYKSVFKLRSGLVQIEMNNGTKLVLEGPTELTIQDAMNSFCHSGKVSISVSQEGIGYKTMTPFGSIVDRGTEFFVSVEKEQTQVEVVKGKVDFSTTPEHFLSLFAQETALAHTTGKLLKTAVSTLSAYINQTLFDDHAKKWNEKLLAVKSERNATWDAVSGMVARLELPVQNKNQIVRTSQNGKGILNIQTTGTKTGRGPLSVTNAISFPGSNDAVIADFPGSYSAMTLVARFRLDHLNQTTNVLLASDDFRQKQGTILWQILKNGTVQFHVTSKDSSRLTEYTSPVIFHRKNLHVWVTLAVVINTNSGKIKFYLDGQQAGQVTMRFREQLNPGHGSIGNFLGSARGVQSRQFQGAISEIMIFDRDLSPKELADPYFYGTGAESVVREDQIRP